MTDAISKLNQALEICKDREDIDANGNPDAWMRVAGLLSATLQAMQGETYRYHCTNCGWKGDSLMAHKSLCSALYMEHYPPVPVVPAVKVWNQAEGRDGKLYTDGWNDCRDALLSAGKGEAPQPAVPDKDYKALYCELLYQVSTKHPDETRHETALRYIRQAEDRTCGVSAAKGAV
jgi:hypothetical protein